MAWATQGFDFGLGTGGAGLALAAAPLTRAAGPVFTYNVLILLAPALAATSAFLLAQFVTRRFAASLVAGYVFGFSSYELGHLLGHLPLASIGLVPIVPYLMLRRHARELSQRLFVALLAAVLFVQFLISTQILFALVVIAAAAVVAAGTILGVGAVRRLLLESAVAALVAVALISPIVGYAVVSDASAPARSPFAESADVLNYAVPTRRTWIRPPGSSDIAARFTGTGAEQGAYLGVPFLVLASLAALERRGSRHRSLLAALFVASIVLSLGTRVKVAGVVVGIAPWAALAPLPVIGSALPARMTMWSALFASVLVALALADRRSVVRWLLVVAGVAATLPNLTLHQWSSGVVRPQFFAQHRDEVYIRDGSTALLLPYGPAGWSMLWQAEAGFRFRIVGGHFALRVTPAERDWADVYEALGSGHLAPRRLCSFLAAHDVDVVVVTPGTRGRVRRALEAATATKPVRALDALVYGVGSCHA